MLNRDRLHSAAREVLCCLREHFNVASSTCKPKKAAFSYRAIKNSDTMSHPSSKKLVCVFLEHLLSTLNRSDWKHLFESLLGGGTLLHDFFLLDSGYGDELLGKLAKDVALQVAEEFGKRLDEYLPAFLFTDGRGSLPSGTLQFNVSTQD